MSNVLKVNYVKRTQKDYSLSMKLQIVGEIERGITSVTEVQRQYGIQSRTTVSRWLRKYGNFDWENKAPSKMPKTNDQRIMELEAKVKLLEKQKKNLEKQVDFADKKVIIFDMMIDIAEEEYKIPIRKNSLPGQSKDSIKSKK